MTDTSQPKAKETKCPRFRLSECFALLAVGLMVLTLVQPLSVPDSVGYVLYVLICLFLVTAVVCRRLERKRGFPTRGSRFVMMLVMLLLFLLAVLLPALG